MLVGELDLAEGPILPEGEQVDLEILPLVHEPIAGLADGALGGIRVLEALEVLLLGEMALHLRPGHPVDGLLHRLVVGIVAVGPLLADAHLLPGIGQQVGLGDLHPAAVLQALQPLHVRILDEERALHLQGRGFAQEGQDLVEEPFQLLLEGGGVVDDPQMGMARPGGHDPVVQGRGLLHGLVAGGVVGEGVRLLRALGGGDQVEDGVVPVPELPLAGVHLLTEPPELLVGHVGLVVHGPPVADDEHLVRGHGPGAPLEQPLLGELQLHLAALIVEVRPAAPGGQAPADELRGGLGHEQHPIPPLGQVVGDPAQGRGLAPAGAAGDDDLLYGHGSIPPFPSAWYCTTFRACLQFVKKTAPLFRGAGAKRSWSVVVAKY